MDVNEMVMGVPAHVVYFTAGDTKDLIGKIEANLEYRRRGDVETDPTFKQVIPYVVLWEGEPYKSRVFVTHRVSAGDERLRNKYSLGAGGHIRQPENVRSGMVREIEEEVGLNINECNVQFEGAILSDASEVDRVHMGLVYSVFGELDTPNSGLPEDLHCLEEELEGEWMTLEQVGELYENLESWSKFVYNYVSYRK